MRVKDKPATPIPGRLLGLVLVIGGGLFIGDFIWAIATYEPSIHVAPLTAWVVFAGGILAATILVGVGVAAVLNSTGKLELPGSIDWTNSEE